MKLTNISEFKVGRSIQGFFLCKEKHFRHTKNDDLYLDLVLTDATGTISGKIWDLVIDFQDRFDKGDPVAVKGKVSEFNNSSQLIVTQINLASYEQYSKYGYSPELLFKKIDESIDELWKRLTVITDTLIPPYKDLITNIIDINKLKIQKIPTSINHPVIIGSFLKHMVITAEIALESIRHYPELDRDLLLSGILLYDIGKVKSINDDLVPDLTDEGRLIGHTVLGRDILLETAQSMKNFPENILTKLEHIILSYQDISTNRSFFVPHIPEAVFINYINELDERINLMMNTIKNNSNKNSTEFESEFNAELFKNKSY